MITRDASSFGEILAGVKAIADLWTPDPNEAEEIWFRGQKCGADSLLPGLYRPPSIVLNYDEEDLLERFHMRATPHVDSKMGDWDWYFLAQHYGIPTRLLDWTGGLVNAVYFALSEFVDISDRREYDKARFVTPPMPKSIDDNSPSVWLLDAGSLNAHACGPDEDNVFTVGGKYTARYLPAEIKKQVPLNREPLAILPPHSNPRLIAQNGFFTIHGYATDSLDAIALANPDAVRLGRVRIDRNAIYNVWREIEVMGADRATVFPGLDSIALVTRWQCQRPT